MINPKHLTIGLFPPPNNRDIEYYPAYNNFLLSTGQCNPAKKELFEIAIHLPRSACWGARLKYRYDRGVHEGSLQMNRNGLIQSTHQCDSVELGLLLFSLRLYFGTCMTLGHAHTSTTNRCIVGYMHPRTGEVGVANSLATHVAAIRRRRIVPYPGCYQVLGNLRIPTPILCQTVGPQCRYICHSPKTIPDSKRES